MYGALPEAKPCARHWRAGGEETDKVTVPMKGVPWWEKQKINE